MVTWPKIKSKIPHFLQNKYVLTLLFFVVWITVFDKNNVIDWIRNKKEIRRIKTEQRISQQQMDAILKTLEQLESNDSLEKFARERYGFHKEKEDVFIVEE